MDIAHSNRHLYSSACTGIYVFKLHEVTAENAADHCVNHRNKTKQTNKQKSVAVVWRKNQITPRYTLPLIQLKGLSKTLLHTS